MHDFNKAARQAWRMMHLMLLVSISKQSIPKQVSSSFNLNMTMVERMKHSLNHIFSPFDFLTTLHVGTRMFHNSQLSSQGKGDQVHGRNLQHIYRIYLLRQSWIKLGASDTFFGDSASGNCKPRGTSTVYFLCESTLRLKAWYRKIFIFSRNILFFSGCDCPESRGRNPIP